VYEEVRLDDISDDLVALVDFIGIDMFVSICDKFGGSQVYFPKKSSIFRNSRNRNIRAMYNGYNLKEIAKIFGITKMQVRNIIKG